jgi:hypothetical protein
MLHRGTYCWSTKKDQNLNTKYEYLFVLHLLLVTPKSPKIDLKKFWKTRFIYQRSTPTFAATKKA